MTVFQLLLKLVADLRSQNGEALATILQIFALVFGFNPINPTPNPNPGIGTMHVASAAESNALADEVEVFVEENDKPGAAKFGDGVFLGKLIALLLKLLPILIGAGKPA